MHDCHFTYERRTIPKHSDSGVFDVDTVGEGLTAWLKMEIKSDTTKGQYLDVLKSDVKISRFNITFRDSKHNHLYEMVTHLFARKIKNAVIDMIQTKLKTFGSYFNNQIISLIDQAKASSSHISKVAHDKTERARHGVENMKLRAKETEGRQDVQETKEEAKSTAKLALERASEKVQDRLDDAKVQIEQSKREKELDRVIETDPVASAAVAVDPVTSNTVTSSSSSTSTISLENPIPPITTTSGFDPRAPFHSESVAPRSPSILSNSSSHYSYSPTQSHDTPFNAAAHALPSESNQFSPHFAAPKFGSSHGEDFSLANTATHVTTNPATSLPDHNDESAWVTAKPAEPVVPKTQQSSAL